MIDYNWYNFDRGLAEYPRPSHTPFYEVVGSLSSF